MNQAEKEAQKAIRRKAAITAAAVVVLVIAAALSWNGKGEYCISIPTEDRETWNCTISDENILEATDFVREKGKCKYSFAGLGPGTSDITMCRTDSSDPSGILEKRVYHVRIAEDMTIVQTSVDREICGDS
ncbi:MAG: hypothetical protein ACI4WY_03765 [Anaerovoracaceae bacterium]